MSSQSLDRIGNLGSVDFTFGGLYMGIGGQKSFSQGVSVRFLREIKTEEEFRDAFEGKYNIGRSIGRYNFNFISLGYCRGYLK